MDDGELKELLILAKENNKILHSMRRSARINSFFRIIYWVVILGSIYGSYYFIQPYIEQLLDMYNQVSSTAPEFFEQLDSVIKNQ